MSKPDSTDGGPRILVLGFGALGALYGFLLARGGAQVYAVARSNAASLRQRGIDIRSVKYGTHPNFKPAGVLSSAEEARNVAQPFDYVLCTIKICPEQRLTGEWIAEYLPEAGGRQRSALPTVVFVENGIGIEEEPYKTLCVGPHAKAATIVSCCAWLGATLADNSTAVEHGEMERLEMGLYPHREEEERKGTSLASSEWRVRALQRFADTYNAGGGNAEVVQGDIQGKRWVKLLWNTGWGGLCTIARQPVRAMLTDENIATTAEAVRKIMLEVLYVARACGADEELFPSKSVDEIFTLTYKQAPRFTPPGGGLLKDDFKPSLLVDLEANRPMELSPIIGNVCKKARQHNVDTPRLDLIFAALHPALMQAVEVAKK